MPAITDPKQLIANDIETCLLAIRHASYEGELDTTANCPSCDKENTYAIDSQQMLSTVTHLQPEYFIETANGIRIYARPLNYQALIKTLQLQFEQEKLVSSVQDKNATDDESLKILSKTLTSMAKTNETVLISCVDKIVILADSTEVTNHAYIAEFLNNVEKNTITQVSALIAEINKVGVKKTLSATCQHCKHTWELAANFNPVTFFTQS